MRIANEKLAGLDRERVIAALEPVLTVHGVDCVDLVWRTDRGEAVLEVTVEQPGSRDPGAGVTLDLCAEVSRDLSAALDAADCIDRRYRLEVGSPGVERPLYGPGDYQRFAGHEARIKLKKPSHGQYVLVGVLGGLDEAGRVLLTVHDEPLAFDSSDVDKANLVFQWKRGERGAKSRPQSKKPAREQSLPAAERSR